MNTLIFGKLNALEYKVNLIHQLLLTQPQPVPQPVYANETVASSSSSVDGIEYYMFNRADLNRIHLSNYGYRFDSEDRDRQYNLVSAVKATSFDTVVKHLYALWSVWEGREYEQVIIKDICWLEEKYC